MPKFQAVSENQKEIASQDLAQYASHASMRIPSALYRSSYIFYELFRFSDAAENRAGAKEPKEEKNDKGKGKGNSRNGVVTQMS